MRDSLGSASMLTFEYEPSKKSEPCECCGGITTTLTRFVYQDGDAWAIYYARFSDKHRDRGVSALVSIGEWADGSNPAERTAFALALSADSSEHKVRVIDASESPWKNAKVIGRILDRVEALAHPLIDEVFHITDHMVEDDAPVKEFLEQGAA
jgi:hypothetical protein